MKSVSEKLSTEARTQSFPAKISTFFIILAIFAFLYFFFGVFVLAFSAVLVAVLLTLLARPIRKGLKWPHWAALTFAGLLLLGVIAVAGYLFGTRIALDIQDVLARMEAAQKEIRAELGSSPLGSLVLSGLGSNGIPITQILTRVFAISTSVIAGVVVSVIAGIYFAANPSLYLNGFLTLFPAERRSEAEETTKDIGNALRLWLQGQFMSMLLVGLLSTVATWAIGLPSPIALGLIAALTEFIPYVGPVIAAVPAVLVAAT